jgi:hypothetical protein
MGHPFGMYIFGDVISLNKIVKDFYILYKVYVMTLVNYSAMTHHCKESLHVFMVINKMEVAYWPPTKSSIHPCRISIPTPRTSIVPWNI